MGPATLTIPSGQTDSDVLTLQVNGARRSYAMYISAAVTLPETVIVHTAPTLTAPFQALQSAGADVQVPANKVTPLIRVVAARLKLVADGAVAADRAFIIAMNSLH